MLVNERDSLRKKLESERIELAEARGEDHEPTVNVQLLDVAERIGNIEGRIEMLDEIISSSTIIELRDECRQAVSLGSKVLLQLHRGGTKERVLACIDGVTGTHREIPILTPDAPMIEKIMGAKIGEQRQYISPRGENITVEIIDIGPAYC